MVNQYSHDVSVLLGNGDATFTRQMRQGTDPAIGPPVAIPVGQSPSALLAGDWNQDGRTDLATVESGSQRVAVLSGKAERRARCARRGTAAGENPNSLVSGDFNGDGLADLGVGCFGASPSLYMLVANPDGSFQDAIRYAGVTEPGPMTAADFDGDGAADIAVSGPQWPEGSGYVSVLTSSDHGGPTQRTWYPMGNSSCGIAIEDINADGHDDLISTDCSSDWGGVYVALREETERLPQAYVFARDTTSRQRRLAI